MIIEFRQILARFGHRITVIKKKKSIPEMIHGVIKSFPGLHWRAFIGPILNKMGVALAFLLLFRLKRRLRPPKHVDLQRNRPILPKESKVLGRKKRIQKKVCIGRRRGPAYRTPLKNPPGLGN